MFYFSGWESGNKQKKLDCNKDKVELSKDLDPVAVPDKTYFGSDEIQTKPEEIQEDLVPSKMNSSQIKVVPSRGSYLGGCNSEDYYVEISGACFGNGWDINSVSICGVEVCHIIVQSSNVVVVYPSSGKPGTGDIVITSKSIGKTTIKNGFTYQVTVPNIPAKEIQISNSHSTSSDLSWIRGNGESCVVFMKQANLGFATASDQTFYSADAVFGSGTQIGSTGWYCVYNGSGTSVSVSGLTPGSDYVAQVFEYNGSSGFETYLNTPSTDNPWIQTTYVRPNDNNTVDNNTGKTLESSKF